MSSTGKSSWVRLLSVSLTLSVTSGCATVSTVPVNSYCVIAKPISYDATKDTSETVKEIEAHNSVFICVCEADCPKGS
jgi:uncharacterized protein YceK